MNDERILLALPLCSNFINYDSNHRGLFWDVVASFGCGVKKSQISPRLYMRHRRLMVSSSCEQNLSYQIVHPNSSHLLSARLIQREDHGRF